MVHLAAVENYYTVEGSLILLGYRTALVLVEHDEQSKSYQWHFETMDDSSEGFIDPSKLSSAKRISPETHDSHDFHGSKCFVGWFEKAHVILGTKSLLDRSDQLSWSGTMECRQTLRPKGYQAGGQFGISAGPINIAPQGAKAWEFFSNVRKFDPTGQYRKTLRSCRRSVSIVIDSQTEQAWLVPTLSLILHLCHRYYQEINHTNNLSAFIPFAEPTYDGHEAVLEAIEMKGDVIVLGEPGESDTETLRQLFLRIHTEFSRAVSTREEPRRGVIFATELMSIIDPPMAGSPLRKIDVSGSEALAASWEAIIKYVDVVGVCSGIGEPIRPELPAGNTCTSCPVLPRNHFYLAAHMQCLEALAYRAKSSTNNLMRGSCVLGGTKTVWNTTAALWTNCSGPGHVSIWSKRPPYHVLQHISDDEERRSNSVVLRNPVTRTGVVVFGDRKKALNPVKRLFGGVQIKLATMRNGSTQ
ncbi:hypothetical protein CGCS363_v011833 [Colletotrichum siamense]|uniref:uncharacterized protein n=1 Tax=Colletotrichum siamense TaxID=690259 RepID=UPI00187315CF|nr:uncharacterized protein CGCS363_v011833 [Colletotrichum siamense]KAF5489382.1 hypothetical protein CGCS363_v011833 [Colletotrichum siamense]